LLARNPKKDFYPEGAPRLKDLSSFPRRESVMRSIATKDLSSHPTKVRFVHPGGTHEGPVAGNVYPACPGSGREDRLHLILSKGQREEGLDSGLYSRV
jgi:hypothetical protein